MRQACLNASIGAVTRRVLIVDDHPGFRAQARELLAAAGYEVVGEATDGESGGRATRLARSAVGDLVMELDRPLLPEELRASLARALGDPSLDLLHAREGQERWVDPDGRPASLPATGSGQRAGTATVVEREGQPLAALIHDPALDQGLVRAAAAAAGMTIENERGRGASPA